MGIEKENASFLLSVIGIANTLGRIVLGYVSDRPWLNRLYTYNISLAICGLSTSARPNKDVSMLDEVHFMFQQWE